MSFISPVDAQPVTSGADSPTEPEPLSPTDTILSILASELGLDLPDINQDDFLEDLGVDSIMAMTLLAQMQKGLGRPGSCPAGT